MDANQVEIYILLWGWERREGTGKSGKYQQQELQKKIHKIVKKGHKVSSGVCLNIGWIASQSHSLFV